jgi:hypothetical protein
VTKAVTKRPPPWLHGWLSVATKAVPKEKVAIPRAPLPAQQPELHIGCPLRHRAVDLRGQECISGPRLHCRILLYRIKVRLFAYPPRFAAALA